MEFEDQLHALIYFHLQEHTSGRHLLQSLQEDALLVNTLPRRKALARSSFFEAMNERGLEQFLLVFKALQQQASKVLPDKHPELGQLAAIDGSLIDAVLSMDWADYRKGAKKAKAHIGFDLNRGLPRKIFLTNGKGGERPFVEQILQPGETAVSDRGYQSHHTSISSRQQASISSAASRRTLSRPALSPFPCLPPVSSFMMPGFFLGGKD